jgi:hypothetical protein
MQSKKLRAFMESGINALMPHAEQVMSLRQSLAGVLPANLRRSCEIANYSQGKVVIFAENSAIAAKLKLMAPTLVRDLSKRVAQVTAIEVRVQPRTTTEHTVIRRELTDEAVQSLRKLGNQLSDSELKNAVLRFADRNVKKY